MAGQPQPALIESDRGRGHDPGLAGALQLGRLGEAEADIVELALHGEHRLVAMLLPGSGDAEGNAAAPFGEQLACPHAIVELGMDAGALNHELVGRQPGELGVAADLDRLPVIGGQQEVGADEAALDDDRIVARRAQCIGVGGQRDALPVAGGAKHGIADKPAAGEGQSPLERPRRIPHQIAGEIDPRIGQPVHPDRERSSVGDDDNVGVERAVARAAFRQHRPALRHRPHRGADAGEAIARAGGGNLDARGAGQAGDAHAERPVIGADPREAEVERAVGPVETIPRRDPERRCREAHVADMDQTGRVHDHVRAERADAAEQLLHRLVGDPPRLRGNPAPEAEAGGTLGHVEPGVDVEQADAIDQIVVHPPLQSRQVAALGEIEGQSQPRLDPVRIEQHVIGDQPEAGDAELAHQGDIGEAAAGKRVIAGDPRRMRPHRHDDVAGAHLGMAARLQPLDRRARHGELRRAQIVEDFRPGEGPVEDQSEAHVLPGQVRRDRARLE